MASGLNSAPSANRLHIGLFGKRNSGKSSLMNAMVGQEVSIVSDVAGTTTDAVQKAIEISPLGPCVFMDTAGFDDEGELGKSRVEKTKLSADKTDVALILVTDCNIEQELQWFFYFKEQNIPVIVMIHKKDMLEEEEASKLIRLIKERTKETPLLVSAKTKEGVKEVIQEIARRLPSEFGIDTITKDLVTKEDVVMLVMPQDIQAPKGRLILPQVQTIRELLDKKCVVVSVVTDQLEEALSLLNRPPKLIITDSQVFSYVYERKPKESKLTSFSVLFAGYKGDLSYYKESVKRVEALTKDSRVLIAECCTHAPLEEDIGRVKLPRLLKQRIGEELSVQVVSGTDFPKDLTEYDLIIQCGGCMFNRRYVMSRIEEAKRQGIPMTNYGIIIAYLKGILEEIET
ncbi:MAG: [Lachnospiraceae bacterium]|nr:[FeFe] hydrogenase H-cluster maturation GTPase HydF [Lachnospiraceae bacterium]